MSEEEKEKISLPNLQKIETLLDLHKPSPDEPKTPLKIPTDQIQPEITPKVKELQTYSRRKQVKNVRIVSSCISKNLIRNQVKKNMIWKLLLL